MSDDQVTSGLQAGHGALVLMLPADAARQIAGWRALRSLPLAVPRSIAAAGRGAF